VAVAIGRAAGYRCQSTGATAVGHIAGYECQGYHATAVGRKAGQYFQEQYAVAIGAEAGRYSQCCEAVAIGYRAGENCQSCGAVAIGAYAGQGDVCCCSGSGTGYSQCSEGQQGDYAVAIGYEAGNYAQGQNAVAIGREAGRRCQGQYAVAIGYQTGYGNNCCSSPQGDYSVAIGYQAGYLSQVANSIAINASIDSLNPGEAGLFINPVRQDAGNTEYSVYYNDMTKELTYTSPVALQVPQNLQDGNGNYTVALGDAGKHIYKTGTGDVYIDINANVALAVGTVITLVTGPTNSTVIRPVNTGTTTLVLSKFGPDDSINVPVDTYVTILKIETDKWMIQT
jgi:hypothetical protein